MLFRYKQKMFDPFHDFLISIPFLHSSNNTTLVYVYANYRYGFP